MTRSVASIGAFNFSILAISAFLSSIAMSFSISYSLSSFAISLAALSSAAFEAPSPRPEPTWPVSVRPAPTFLIKSKNLLEPKNPGSLSFLDTGLRAVLKYVSGSIPLDSKALIILTCFSTCAFCSLRESMPGNLVLSNSNFNSSGDKPSNLLVVSKRLSASVLFRLKPGVSMSFSKLVISSTFTSAGLCMSSSANLFSKSILSCCSSSNMGVIGSVDGSKLGAIVCIAS